MKRDKSKRQFALTQHLMVSFLFGNLEPERRRICHFGVLLSFLFDYLQESGTITCFTAQHDINFYHFMYTCTTSTVLAGESSLAAWYFSEEQQLEQHWTLESGT